MSRLRFSWSAPNLSPFHFLPLPFTPALTVALKGEGYLIIIEVSSYSTSGFFFALPFISSFFFTYLFFTFFRPGEPNESLLLDELIMFR